MPAYFENALFSISGSDQCINNVRTRFMLTAPPTKMLWSRDSDETKMTFTRRQMGACLFRGLCLALILASCWASGSAGAQQYPSKPVRVVVGAPAGGLTDVVSRLVSQFLQEKLGQPFVVENITGANTTLGAVQVARSAPDGYTLLMNPSIFVITPMLMSVPYDVLKDFTPISNFGTVPLAFGILSRHSGEDPEGVRRARQGQSR